MNQRDNHSMGADGTAALPPALEAALVEETAEERAALAELWHLAGPTPHAEPDDATFRRLGAEIWQNLQPAIATQARPPARIHRMRPTLRLVSTRTTRWAALAACLAMLMAVGVLLSQQPTTLEAPRGATAEHTLPDGSTVILNSGSTLRYWNGFGRSARRVDLAGEAFFDVARQEKPFVIETFNGTVTVLGTSFNVRAWPDDVAPATEVSVFSGTVAFAPENNPDGALLLTAGMAARLIGETSDVPTPLTGVEVQHALAWRDGGFKVTDRPLAAVVREIERRYDVSIRIASEHLLDKPVALLLEESEGPERILDDLCEIHACEYRLADGGYEIFQPVAE